MSKDDEAPDLDAWLKRSGRTATLKTSPYGLNDSTCYRVLLAQDGRPIAAGYGIDEKTARSDAWDNLPPRWRRNGETELPGIPLDPFFIECVRHASANKELVQQFDRLRGTNLMRIGKPIELAVDAATGKLDDDIRQFLQFVREFVYERIDIYK